MKPPWSRATNTSGRRTTPVASAGADYDRVPVANGVNGCLTRDRRAAAAAGACPLLRRRINGAGRTRAAAEKR
ncbi:MAG TPA: hypothetical protein VH643_38870 [Gemmataceae bacterium]